MTGLRCTDRATNRLGYKTLGKTGAKTQIAPPDENKPTWSSDTLFCFAVYNPDDKPRTLEKVRGRENWPLWKEAMDKEMAQLEELGTYKVTGLLPNRKAIGCRWVFIVKHDMAGNIDKYKARLVAQGFGQMPGLDFFETYVPVMRIELFRALCAIAARLDLEIDGADIKAASGSARDPDRPFRVHPQSCGIPSSSITYLLHAYHHHQLSVSIHLSINLQVSLSHGGPPHVHTAVNRE